jgi:hypothetical protein
LHEYRDKSKETRNKGMELGGVKLTENDGSSRNKET